MTSNLSRWKSLYRLKELLTTSVKVSTLHRLQADQVLQVSKFLGNPYMLGRTLSGLTATPVWIGLNIFIYLILIRSGQAGAWYHRKLGEWSIHSWVDIASRLPIQALICSIWSSAKITSYWKQIRGSSNLWETWNRRGIPPWLSLSSIPNDIFD